MVAFALAESAVAVTPAEAPGATPAPESASTDVRWPLAVPADWSRTVSAAGTVQVVVAVDLSVQYDTTHEPLRVTLAPGVVCPVRDAVSPADANAETGLVGSTPVYAASCEVDLVRGGVGHRDGRAGVRAGGDLVVQAGAQVRRAGGALADEGPAGRVGADRVVRVRRREQAPSRHRPARSQAP